MFSSQKETVEHVEKSERPFQYGMPGTVSEPYNHNLPSKDGRKKLAGVAQCPIYIHDFKQNTRGASNSYTENDWKTGSEIHQSRYRHECNDVNTKRCMHGHSSKNCTHRLGKVHYGAKVDKSFLFKLEHKAVADKLEETYWAQWKPNKSPSSPKTKGLYTENEKVCFPDDDDVSENKERGDSSEAIVATPLSEVESVPSGSTMEVTEEKQNPELQIEPVIEMDTISLSPRSNSATEVPTIKHTDSLILIARKQSVEKPHYQQPKCIKLFKNAGYVSTASINYIKGGSYPLKSCLRKESASFKTSSALGVRSSLSRRPPAGKAGRFLH
ncbi:hypothetical protein PPYR_07777 [Photinus pyralis]|uniref:Uncharacterized protein n=1 Tax=Photinus pyralis TaxID=7054 RepID=A0A5N4ARE4_PHOPY|nr:uncharacterized protein LOC116169444 [Photinus pyralis]KAB0799897.1 hypothetical protein PPYR_07777 [Photinus pyralis]